MRRRSTPPPISTTSSARSLRTGSCSMRCTTVGRDAEHLGTYTDDRLRGEPAAQLPGASAIHRSVMTTHRPASTQDDIRVQEPVTTPGLLRSAKPRPRSYQCRATVRSAPGGQRATTIRGARGSLRLAADETMTRSSARRLPPAGSQRRRRFCRQSTAAAPPVNRTRSVRIMMRCGPRASAPVSISRFER